MSEGEVCLPFMYLYARWELLWAIQIFIVVFLWPLSRCQLTSLVCWLFHIHKWFGKGKPRATHLWNHGIFQCSAASGQPCFWPAHTHTHTMYVHIHTKCVHTHTHTHTHAYNFASVLQPPTVVVVHKEKTFSLSSTCNNDVYHIVFKL